jgi:hypothetical protein
MEPTQRRSVGGAGYGSSLTPGDASTRRQQRTVNAEYERKVGEALKLESLIIRLPTWDILHLFMLLMQLPVDHHDWNDDWNVA